MKAGGYTLESGNWKVKSEHKRQEVGDWLLDAEVRKLETRIRIQEASD